MKVNSLSEFELESEGFKIKLKRAVSAPAAVEAALEPVAVPTTPKKKAGDDKGTLVELKAPMVGTFYLSPSPESAPFVERGSQVNPDTVVCIVEAMKVMNEVKAEIRGTVVDIVATSGKPVEYGQVLFLIKPN